MKKEVEELLNEKSSKKQSLTEVLIEFFASGLAFLMLSPFLIPAYQCFHWLVTGKWKPISTAVLFSRILPSAL